MQLIDVIYSSVAFSAIIMLLLILFSYVVSSFRKRRKSNNEIHFRRTILSNKIYLSSDTLAVPATVRIEQSKNLPRINESPLVEERSYQVNHRSRYKIINDPGLNRTNYSYQSSDGRFKKVI